MSLGYVPRGPRRDDAAAREVVSVKAELMCPRCGCGMDSGWQYPSCADFPTAEERFAAHRTYCAPSRHALDVCGMCCDELREEPA